MFFLADSARTAPHGNVVMFMGTRWNHGTRGWADTVVTGAASGVGFALAERFARDGLDSVEEAALVSAAERIGAELGGIQK
jgi:hypothetical protein